MGLDGPRPSSWSMRAESLVPLRVVTMTSAQNWFSDSAAMSGCSPTPIRGSSFAVSGSATAESSKWAKTTRPSVSARAVTYWIENLPSSPVRGSGWSVCGSRRELVSISIPATSPGFSPSSRTSFSMQLMAGWVEPQHGNCFNPKPFSTMSSGSAQLSNIFSASKFPGPLKTLRNPWPCSKASPAAVKPCRASIAASMPFLTQWPTWSGLVMVPKLALTPDASDTAKASAVSVSSSDKPSSSAEAATVPKIPRVVVGCQPFS